MNLHQGRGAGSEEGLRKREAKFQAAVMRVFKEPKMHVFRLENSVAVGMPDINVCFEGQEHWIEMKASIRNEILLRPFQRAFMELRTQAGGNCWIVADWRQVHAGEVVAHDIVVSPWPTPVEPVNRFGKPYLRVMPESYTIFPKSGQGYLKEIRNRIFQ